MSVTAIICEYNPLTRGHLYHMERAKGETKCDTLVCVMSGSFTQRGEPAIQTKYVRAESAIKAGADIVIELPFVYSISSADNFAFGALKTLSIFPDVKTLSFGSEIGDITSLSKAAEFLQNEPEEYKTLIKQLLKSGYSFPKARDEALRKYSDDHSITGISDILNSPNNILAISYINAAKKFFDSLAFHTVKRIGDYNGAIVEPLPSASAVRDAVINNKDYAHAVPDFTFDSLKTAERVSDFWKEYILYKMKSSPADYLEKIYDMSEGIHNRLKNAAEVSTSYDEYLTKAKTKRYTLAKIRRLSLFTLFDITEDLYNDIMREKPYIQILALNKDRKDLLKKLSENNIPFFTDYSDELCLSRMADKRAHEYLSFLLKERNIQYSMSLI